MIDPQLGEYDGYDEAYEDEGGVFLVALYDAGSIARTFRRDDRGLPWEHEGSFIRVKEGEA